MKSTKTVQSYSDTSKEKRRSSLKNTEYGFPDPIKNYDNDKVTNKQCKPKDGRNSPWDFTCPQYDQRSSNFINAGTHYGVGVNQPVGHKGNPKQVVDVLPQGRRNTLQDDDLG